MGLPSEFGLDNLRIQLYNWVEMNSFIADQPKSNPSLFRILNCDVLNAVSLNISLRYVNGLCGTLCMSAFEKLNLILTC